MDANEFLIVRSGNFVQVARGTQAITEAKKNQDGDQKMYAGVYNEHTDIFLTHNGMRINLRFKVT